MKKALKAILIVILCLLAAGGTGYLFFKNLNKSVSAFNSVNSFVLGADQSEFSKSIKSVATTGGDRFNLLISTEEDLQDITFSLNSYLVNYHNTSMEGSIEDKLNALISSRSVLENMMEEYFIKTANNAFDKVSGADDIYTKFASYIVEFTDFLTHMESVVKVSVTTENVDVKFDVFDVYLNVANLTLNGLKANSTVNFTNLTYMVNHFELQNGYLKTANTKGDFANENNQFIANYSTCDKTEFAKNLTDNMAEATATSSTDQLKAAYYLKQILGA